MTQEIPAMVVELLQLRQRMRATVHYGNPMPAWRLVSPTAVPYGSTSVGWPPIPANCCASGSGIAMG